MDRSDFPAPEEGLLLTHFVVVSDVARSREFYTRLLDAKVVSPENPAILKAGNSWIIMNPGGSWHSGQARYHARRTYARCPCIVVSQREGCGHQGHAGATPETRHRVPHRPVGPRGRDPRRTCVTQTGT